VEKYEKGANRIEGSRLQQIADVRKVPVSYFFEGAPGTGTAAEPSEDGVDTFFVNNDSIVRPFNTLPTELQNMMVLLMRTLAEQCGR
jgi:hypothetical protein